MASASASGTTALPCLPGWYNNAERYPDMSLLLQTSSEVQPRPTKRRRTRSTALVQHREVQLHAGFVASHSNYFRTRLENTENFGMARRGGGAKVLEEVFHSDAEVSAAEVVLRFMYEGRLEEGVVHDVEQLLLAYMVADRWETPGCMSACQACIQDLARPQPAEPEASEPTNRSALSPRPGLPGLPSDPVPCSSRCAGQCKPPGAVLLAAVGACGGLGSAA